MERIVQKMLVFGALFGVVFLQYVTAQTVHVVGDSMGWNIPPNNTASYANWATGKTFVVGDILVFNFATNQHDVLKVPRASYDACTQDNALGNPMLTGPTNVTLDSAGDHYFICTFGRHCQAGQKLAITVSGNTGANPPSISPPTTPVIPSPSSNEPDACAPTPSTTPNVSRPRTMAPSPTQIPLDSSSTTTLASFLLIFGSMAAALVF